MGSVAEEGQLDQMILPEVVTGPLRSALKEANDAAKRLNPALEVLERGLTKASPEREAQYAVHLAILLARIEKLTTELRTVRLWSLEMGHFLKHWHPIGPSFPVEAGGQPGRQ
jgi:hypothetical protein